MFSATEQKKCLACSKSILGRADKKFCNDYCRNAYNNQLKASDQTIIRQVNSFLLRNRRILAHVLGEEKMVKVTREQLVLHGYNFKFSTHSYRNKNDNVYFFCYEYGYLALEGNWFLIVKRKEI